MKKYFIFVLCAILSVGILTGCESNDIKDEKNDEPAEDEIREVIGCNGCFFGYPRTAHVGETISDDNKKSDYMEWETYPGFTGYTVSDDGLIIKAYACGIADGKAFCVEGANPDAFESNKNILMQVFGEENCEQTQDYFNSFQCDGSKYDIKYGISIQPDGHVHVSACSIHKDGEIICY